VILAAAACVLAGLAVGLLGWALRYQPPSIEAPLPHVEVLKE
jgi:hypothetical protein